MGSSSSYLSPGPWKHTQGSWVRVFPFAVFLSFWRAFFFFLHPRRLNVVFSIGVYYFACRLWESYRWDLFFCILFFFLPFHLGNIGRLGHLRAFTTTLYVQCALPVTLDLRMCQDTPTGASCNERLAATQKTTNCILCTEYDWFLERDLTHR